VNASQKARIRRILAEDKTGVPVHIDGERLVIVGPRGLTILERVVVADVEPMPGDRVMVTLEGMLPLNKGGWPTEAAARCLEVYCKD
jgi:hypothetical protein